MELKIGLVHTSRELELEMEDDADSVAGNTENALQNGQRMIWFTDNKGRRIGVVAEHLAYIELAAPEAQRVVGFSS